jgi:large subunit ribosomal protein L29
MKTTEKTKIREMNDAELQNKLEDLKKELFNLRFQHAINQLDNPMRLKAVKKEIAVVKTIIRENEIKNGVEMAEA